MPEDLKLSQIGSSQLPPPFTGGLHSPGVRNLCLLFPEIVYYTAVGDGKQTSHQQEFSHNPPWQLFAPCIPTAAAHSVRDLLCAGPIVYLSHCVPGALCTSFIVYQFHCVPVPLCTRPIVYQTYCVPVSCTSPIVFQSHCVPSQSHCVPV